jgi:hypothetical protein
MEYGNSRGARRNCLRRGCLAPVVDRSQTSAVRNHDLAKMAASLEVTVGSLRLGEWEDAIDHRPQLMSETGEDPRPCFREG